MANIYTGWRGLAVLNGTTAIRFTSESIDVPLAINVMQDIHAGMRSDSVYNYDLVKPTGTIEFPLTSDNTTGFTTTISSDLITLISQVLANPPTMLSGGGDLKIYRGDVVKTLTSPWINSIKISGSAGSPVSVTVDIKSIYGEYTEQTLSDPPNVTLPKARAILFNELDWAATVSRLKLATLNNDVITPRSFDITIETGLVDDDSYNSGNPRALRGFALGRLAVSGSLEFVGAAINSTNIAPPRGTASGEGNFIPWTESVNIGDLFTIRGGLWDSRTMQTPGMSDIAKTSVTFKALYSLVDAGGDTTKLPIALGTLLGGTGV